VILLDRDTTLPERPELAETTISFSSGISTETNESLFAVSGS
jgi:hypothetical protein